MPDTDIPLATSRYYCRDVTRRANSSFPLAFRLLSPPRREAMTALYAFLRLTDDLADEPGDPATRRIALKDWRRRTHAAIAGRFSHPAHPALYDLVHQFALPVRYLDAVLDGVETDLEPVRFQNFEQDLYPYCWKVASAVGLACLSIWGLKNTTDPERAVVLAGKAGIAFQLTNILRDLGEDRARGRVYLPADELARFGCPPERWHEPAFHTLMQFQVERARQYYAESSELTDLLPNEGRAVFTVMAGLYRRLLEEIARRESAVLHQRVRLRPWTKGRIFLAAWPLRWGWW